MCIASFKKIKSVLGFDERAHLSMSCQWFHFHVSHLIKLWLHVYRLLNSERVR